MSKENCSSPICAYLIASIDCWNRHKLGRNGLSAFIAKVRSPGNQPSARVCSGQNSDIASYPCDAWTCACRYFFGGKNSAVSLYDGETCACRYFCGILAFSRSEQKCGKGWSEFDDWGCPVAPLSAASVSSVLGWRHASAEPSELGENGLFSP